nr:heavy metal translocating P-type ATPase [uncultured Lichenicoccus sp.]
MGIPAPPEGAQDGIGRARARIVDLAIEGMTCASCAGRVERALGQGDGVLSALVNLATEQARVSVSAGRAEDDAALGARLRDAVQRAGYGARVLPPEPDGAADEHAALDRRERLHLVLACLLSAPLLIAMVLHVVFMLSHQDRLASEAMLPGWLQFLLATPVQFWLGWRFYRAGASAVRHATGNMDLLVALGSSAAWGLSTVSLLRGSTTLYFESSALIITFILFGKWLERGARRRAAASVRALTRLRPDTVLRLDAAGSEHEVLLGEVRVGDLLVVRPGGRVAVDGTVRDGECSVDEQLLTGESRAVAKGPGDTVIAGSLAVDGRLVVLTAAVGAETRLAGIVRLIDSAQASRAPVQRLVDRVSAIFVPVVLGLAALTFAGWWVETGQVSRALLDAVSVLVIACPCALGLATPAALVAGIGAAARAGILIRDAASIERARGIGIVAFDKTGTLTEGRPVLDRVIPAEGGDHPEGGQAAGLHYEKAAELLSLAAAMQAGSEHPLAEAVRASSGHAVTLPAERFVAVAGRGVTARVGGRSLLLGNRRMMETEGLVLGGALAEEADRIDAEGGTVSFLAERAPIDWSGRASGGGRILGLLGFSDTIRPGAAQAMARLHAMGIMSVMLTGDGEGAARHVAEAAGLDRMLAGISPEGKAASVEALHRELRGTSRPSVAMVGDGLNDAPALAASDLGIAMGRGTDAAIEAAGITLMRPDPALVADTIEIAGLISSRIRQGLFWAFAYNLVGIPLAMAGLLSPAVAGGAMALSSVSVVFNALRLKGWRPH